MKILGYIRKYSFAITFKKLINALKVLLSMGLSYVLRKPIVWGYPVMLMIEPSNYCNLKCPLCPSGNGAMTRAKGNMGFDEFTTLIDEIADHTIIVLMWNQGEPYLNSDLNKMVNYLHQKKIVSVVSTNGHFIRNESEADDIIKSGLDEMIVSFDGADQETYSKYRVGGNIEQVIQGIKLLVKSKDKLKVSKPEINLQYIVMKHNESDIEKAKKIADTLSVDKFIIKTAQVYTDSDASEYLPQNNELSRYDTKDGKISVKGQPNGCKYLWYASAINWDQSVSPCCFDKNADFKLGVLSDGSSFNSIWKNSEYQKFRANILKDGRTIEMCNNCSEGYRGMISFIDDIRGE
jgi:MoaA/NifB/PqqE/SkfB family radical SAM enzyme